MYQRNQKTWHKHFDFMFLDLLCMEISFVIAFFLRFGAPKAEYTLFRGEFAQSYRDVMIMIVCFHVASVLFTAPYSGILRRNSAQEMKKVLLHNVYVLVGIIVTLFIMRSSVEYSRTVVLGFPVTDCFLMFFYRYFYKRYLKKELNRSDKQDYMLLIAPAGQINGILQSFYRDGFSTIKIVGIALVDDLKHYTREDVLSDIEAAATAEAISSKQGEIRGIPVIGTLQDVYEYARTNIVDEVLICMDGEEVNEAANTLISMGITVHVAIQNLVQIPRATVNRVNGISVITASVNTVTSSQLIVKRVIDIFFGLCGSIVTVLLTIIIAPMMWLADPGPVFFRQERVGKNGRTFRIWKFRTMYKDAETRKAELMEQNKMSGLMFKMDDDPRIIGYGKKFSLGKFLRESSIDELPQSFNILAGSMSVVGTRPPTVKEYEQYELHHKGRLATKPGLTGMWQISGRSDITDFEEVVRLDKEYIDNFSLILDLEIMLKTVKVVLGKEGSV